MQQRGDCGVDNNVQQQKSALKVSNQEWFKSKLIISHASIFYDTCPYSSQNTPWTARQPLAGHADHHDWQVSLFLQSTRLSDWQRIITPKASSAHPNKRQRQQKDHTQKQVCPQVVGCQVYKSRLTISFRFTIQQETSVNNFATQLHNFVMSPNENEPLHIL